MRLARWDPFKTTLTRWDPMKEPEDADEKSVLADFKEGVLNVHLAKSANVKPKAVEVKVA